MNKDEVLIIKPQFPVKADTMNNIYKKLIEQAKTGIVLLPYGYEVVIAPKDVEIKTENDDFYTRCPYCGKRHTFGAE